MPADIVRFNSETAAAGKLRRVWDLPAAGQSTEGRAGYNIEANYR
jgi:hypothetical protein